MRSLVVVLTLLFGTLLASCATGGSSASAEGELFGSHNLSAFASQTDPSIYWCALQYAKDGQGADRPSWTDGCTTGLCPRGADQRKHWSAGGGYWTCLVPGTPPLRPLIAVPTGSTGSTGNTTTTTTQPTTTTTTTTTTPPQSMFLAAVTQQIPSVAQAISNGASDASEIKQLGPFLCQQVLNNQSTVGPYVTTVHDIEETSDLGGTVDAGFSPFNLTPSTAALFISLAVENVCPSEISAIPAGYPGSQQ